MSLPALSRPLRSGYPSRPRCRGVSIILTPDLDSLARCGSTTVPTEEPKNKSGSSIAPSILPHRPLFTGKIKGSVQPLPSCPQVQGAILRCPLEVPSIAPYPQAARPGSGPFSRRFSSCRKPVSHAPVPWPLHPLICLQGFPAPSEWLLSHD